MVTGVNESKTLTKHILYKYECGFGGKICNSNQKWKNDKFEYKNPEQYHMCKKIIFRILLHVVANMANM